MNTMETKFQNSHDPSRQSSSFRRHQKQRFWQILAPIILGGLATLAVALLMVLTLTGTVSGGNLSKIAATSTIWLILPLLFFGVLLAVLLLGMIFLAARALNFLPPYTFLVQQYAALVEAKIKLWTIKATSPIITIKSIGASLGTLVKNLFSWVK